MRVYGKMWLHDLLINCFMYQQAVGGQPSSEVRFSTEESQRFTRQSSRGQTQQARLPIQEQQPQVRPVSSL